MRDFWKKQGLGESNNLLFLCLLSHFSCVQLFEAPGIFQARILVWGAIPSSRGSSRPMDRTHISYASCIGRWVLYHQHHLGGPADFRAHCWLSFTVPVSPGHMLLLRVPLVDCYIRSCDRIQAVSQAEWKACS